MPQDQSVRCIDDVHCDGNYVIRPNVYPAVSVIHHCDRIPATIVREFASLECATAWLAKSKRLRTFRGV